MTLFLHIGSHKTGTTSVQAYLRKNRRKLKDEGLLYLTAPGGTAANVLANTLRSANRAEADQIVAGMIAENQDAAPDSRRLISAENLFLVDPQEFRALIEGTLWQTNEPLVILCYLRRQDSYLESLYLHALRDGRTRKPVGRFVEAKLNEGACDYLKTLTAWKAAFPEAEWRVRPYAKALMAGGDVVQDFLTALDMPQAAETVTKAPRLNRRIGRDLSELLTLVALNSNADTAAIFQTLEGAGITGGDDDAPVLGPNHRRKIVEGFAEQNAILTKDWLGGDGRLFEPDPEAKRAKPPFTPEQRQLIGAVIKALWQNRDRGDHPPPGSAAPTARKATPKAAKKAATKAKPAPAPKPPEAPPAG